MDGDHRLEQCATTTEAVLHEVFNQLHRYRVSMEAMILKPNMVLPGKDSPEKASPEEVADITVSTLLRAVPAAVPGIAFLSGGQEPESASTHLSTMNARWRRRVPWVLTFSFARAIQQPALSLWKGKEANKAAAQKALYQWSGFSGMAREGRYNPDLERVD
jgi:fructose-bisphosphate aldolase class I